MKHRTFMLFALMAGLTAPTVAYAQAPAETPPAEQTPPATPSTPVEAPPTAPSADAAQTPPVPDAGSTTPDAGSTTKPIVKEKKPKVRRPEPAFDPRWAPTPAPIWWGKPFETPQTPVERWYGWQTMIALVVPDVLTVTGYVNDAFGVAALGVSAHMLTGPIVHWAHGRVGRGFGVLGLNLTLGAVGALAGAFSRPAGFPLPAFMGYLAGPVLDIALFSTEMTKEPMVRASNRSPLGVTFGVVPVVDSTQRGLLLTGQF